MSLAASEPIKATGASFPLARKFNRDFVFQHVQEANVFPTFIGKTDHFWYGIQTPNGTKYWRADPIKKAKETLFDRAKLAAQLSEKPLDEDDEEDPQDKKVEEKKLEAKKDEVKKDENNKAEAKKDELKSEAPRTKFEIKVPTNAELAANLKGHILLVHGDMDNNVHPANTMRLVDALIKANKRFDMIILPGKRHAFMDYQPYFTQRMWDFFAEHLLDNRQTDADLYDRKPRK